jgi:hypothetical protein
MNNESTISLYRKGLKRVLLYYFTGILATLVFHFIVGRENVYAPPLSVIVLLLLFVIGMLWAVLNLTSLVSQESRPQTLGELTIHIVVFAISALLIMIRVGAI